MTQIKDKWGWDGGGVRVLTPPDEVVQMLQEIEALSGRALALQAWAARLSMHTAAGEDPDQFAMPENLAEYWLHGEGAAKVRWCTDGSFDRARRLLLKEGVPAHMVDGAVANLYRRACGKHPGPHND